MAIAPCSFCGRRFRGRAAYIYKSVVEGAGRAQVRERRCPDCYEVYVLDITKWAVQVLDGTAQGELGEPRVCGVCAGALERRLAFFATSYDQAGERSDFYAPICASCAERKLPGQLELYS